MAFKVTTPIRDTKDNHHYYSAGDIFPREGLDVDEDRLAELIAGGYVVEETNDLSKLKKDELVALAAEKGIDVDTKDTKADIIEKLGE